MNPKEKNNKQQREYKKVTQMKSKRRQRLK